MKAKVKSSEQYALEMTNLRLKIKDLKRKSQKQKEIHAELLDSENRFRMIFENANDGIILHDTQGNIFDVNPVMYKRLGYTKTEMLKMSLKDLITPEFSSKVKERMDKLKSDGVAIFESADRRKDGTIMPVEVSARYVEYDGKTIIQSIVRDIQERKLAEDLVAKALQDKTMLKEEIRSQFNVNHSIFIHMLAQLEENFQSPLLEPALEKHKKRLKAITYIHDKVYNYNSLTRIDLGSVVKSLATYQYNFYWKSRNHISIQRDINDIHFDIRKTLLCALLINELVSNALLHAFSNTENGTILIKVKISNSGRYTLTVRDNGNGLPTGLDIHNPSTLGLKIVNEFVTQLDGDMILNQKHGTEIKVHFK